MKATRTLRGLAFAAALAAAGIGTAEVALAEEIFVPVTIYRTGPYAPGGSGVGGGFIDYMALLNERDGGINGVKIAWEECETAYQPDRMVECYERLKGRGEKGATVFNPLGTGLTYAIMERATEDKIPVLTMGYGRTDASDGRVWPYLFPLIVNYWNQSTAKIAYIAEQEGGYENLKGLKIANLLHDSAYGKETHTVLEAQAEKYGFEVAHFPVAHPGLDQKATWLQISRRFKPDWVILRGWGVMCSTAIKEAARINFPREKMIGVWWCGSEEDVIAAGSAAKGYITTTFHAPGSDFPVINEIMEHVHNKGNGNIDTERVGSIYYNRGILQAILTTEAIRTAMDKFGNRPVSGEEVQWGLENLNITEERIEELGAAGLVSPLKTSCFDHEGGGLVKVQQWDGDKWVLITDDWIEPDWGLTRPLVEASAAAYAEEKGVAVRDCPAETG